MSEERILAALPDVADCTVIIVPDNGKYVADVLLELTPDAADVDRTEAVKAAVGEEVAAIVRKVTAVGAEEVPVTVTGKVRKVALREERLTGADA
jgi:acyl-coenzyme A synthetase/AMP-(fatty) acid ligase